MLVSIVPAAIGALRAYWQLRELLAGLVGAADVGQLSTSRHRNVPYLPDYH